MRCSGHSHSARRDYEGWDGGESPKPAHTPTGVVFLSYASEDRSHLITAHEAFLVPVVIDDAGEDEEHVPEKFREVQWTRLPAGQTPARFIAHIRQLPSGEPGRALLGARPPAVARDNFHPQCFGERVNDRAGIRHR